MKESELKIGGFYPDPEDVLTHFIREPDLIVLRVKTKDSLIFDYHENASISISGKSKSDYLEYLKNCFNAPANNSPS